MHPHHMHGGGGHGGHGHHGLPGSAFANWGGNWDYPGYETVYIEQQGVPDWVWIAGGAFAGILLALMTRSR